MEVKECSRSCYYPVELSATIRHILENKGRYAVIGLPCVIKSLRLAMKLSPRLRDRIAFLLGLTCGQTKTAHFAEYVCAMAGGNPRNLKDIVCRIKSPERPASDIGFRIRCNGDAEDPAHAVIHFTDGVSRIWIDRYFTPLCCDICDDVFAELADVSFMDAWLPDYAGDWRGHSIVLTREDRIDAILTKYIDTAEVDLTPIRIENAVRSQAGQILEKRVAVHERMRLLRKSGVSTGYTPRGNRGNVLHRLETRLKYKVSRMSASAWLECGKDIGEFKKRMQSVRWRLFLVRRLRRRMQTFAGRLRRM
jgi:coenzyme F420-reducing hydrogenase beta subunit